jgi:hypothetical protein
VLGESSIEETLSLHPASAAATSKASSCRLDDDANLNAGSEDRSKTTFAKQGAAVAAGVGPVRSAGMQRSTSVRERVRALESKGSSTSAGPVRTRAASERGYVVSSLSTRSGAPPLTTEERQMLQARAEKKKIMKERKKVHSLLF